MKPRPTCHLLAPVFRLLFAATASLLVNASRAQTPTAVSTFHAIGLYWQPTDASATNPCSVQYRPVGTGTWFSGLNLFFDGTNRPTSIGGTPITKDPARINEYRGSIVDLSPGTNYEIKLTLVSGTTQTITCATMAENFWNVSPLSTTAVTSRTTQFVISTGGDPATGRFAIYDGANGGGPGVNATIDLSANSSSPAVSVQASYVVLRNCKIIGGKHGIQLGDGVTGTSTTVSPTNDIHHIVIENCDVSGWGTFVLLSDGTPSCWGANYDAGIFAKSRLLQHVIVQRNKIHDPRTRANSWNTNAQTSVLPSSSNGHHPQGPQGITWLGKDQSAGFVGTAGHHIIRYNEIYSTDGVGDGDAATAGHGFNDGIGGDANQSFAGFPGRDSDVYCNYVANCWDDGLEIEGGSMNVRVWGNFIDYTFESMAHAGSSLGPLYSFRNITGFNRADPQRAENPANDVYHDTDYPLGHAYPSGGGIYKLGWSGAIDGWAYAQLNSFHNTSLQPVYNGRPAGGGSIAFNSKPVENLVLRNNVFQLKWPTNIVMTLPTSAQSLPGNDFDYDQTSASFGTIGFGRETNGLTNSTPVYSTFPGPRAAEMAAGSPGRDSGVVIPNFNDFFNNGGPDRGAVENGKGLIPVGVSADWSNYLINASTDTIPTITTLTIPAGKVGVAYSVTLVATGGNGAIGWKLRDGALPAGFTLSSTGVLSGPAPTVASVASFVVAAGDSDSILGLPDQATQGYLLLINPLDDKLGPVVAPATIRSGTDTSNKYTITAPYGTSASGSTTRVVAITLLDSTGTPQGSTSTSNPLPNAGGRVAFFYYSPLGLTPAANYQWRIELKASSSGAVLDTQIISPVNVLRQPIHIDQTSVPSATVGVAYSKQLTVRDENPPVTWTYTGSLPPGVTMSSAGLISGTPTSPGTYTFTAKVTDAIPSSDTETMDLVVAGTNSVPSITTTSLPNGVDGVDYTQTLAATGGDGALVWSLDSGALPDGLTLASDGTISGTPTLVGTYSFTVRVADSDAITGASDEDTQALTIVIGPRVISVNVSDTANALVATDVAGAVPAVNWNNSTVNNEILTNTKDNTGLPTTADVSFGSTAFAYNNNTAGTSGDAKMMRSQRALSNASSMITTTSQVPYALYDVYVYWGGRVSTESVPATMSVDFQLWNGTAWVSNQIKYIKDSDHAWDGIYNESTATSAAAAVDGNEYVVFRDVTATQFRIVATTGVRTGISGLQIVKQ